MKNNYIHTKHLQFLFAQLTKDAPKSIQPILASIQEEQSGRDSTYNASELTISIIERLRQLSSVESGTCACSPESIEALSREISIRTFELEKGLAFKATHNIQNLLFVGDVHGQSSKLFELMQSQDCIEDQYETAFINSHLVFVGDLANMPTNIQGDDLAVLRRVRSLTETNRAFCLMGNHELIAIKAQLGFTTECDSGSFVDKVQKREDAALYWVEWFKTLPVYLDFGEIRAVHACWHQETIDRLKPYLTETNAIKPECWAFILDPEHELSELLCVLLEGPKAKLPKGHYYLNKNGCPSAAARIAWWKNRYGIASISDLTVNTEVHLSPDIEQYVSVEELNWVEPPIYPTIIGHYGLEPTQYPSKLSDRVVCVDYQAIMPGADLVGYWVYLSEWESVDELTDNRHFVVKQQPCDGALVSNGVRQLIIQGLNRTPQAMVDEETLARVSKILYQEWTPYSEFDQTIREAYYPVVNDTRYNFELSALSVAAVGNIEQLAGYLLLTEQYAIGINRPEAERECSSVAEKVFKFAP